LALAFIAKATANATTKGAIMKRLSRGEFFARQKAEAWERARAHQERDARETALTLIEDRGAVNAKAWADHCMVRSNDGFWRKVSDEIARWIAVEKEINKAAARSPSMSRRERALIHKALS
jgi:hypothetical protein